MIQKQQLKLNLKKRLFSPSVGTKQSLLLAPTYFSGLNSNYTSPTSAYVISPLPHSVNSYFRSHLINKSFSDSPEKNQISQYTFLEHLVPLFYNIKLAFRFYVCIFLSLPREYLFLLLCSYGLPSPATHKELSQHVLNEEQVL